MTLPKSPTHYLLPPLKNGQEHRYFKSLQKYKSEFKKNSPTWQSLVTQKRLKPQSLSLKDTKGQKESLAFLNPYNRSQDGFDTLKTPRPNPLPPQESENPSLTLPSKKKDSKAPHQAPMPHNIFDRSQKDNPHQNAVHLSVGSSKAPFYPKRVQEETIGESPKKGELYPHNEAFPSDEPRVNSRSSFKPFINEGSQKAPLTDTRFLFQQEQTPFKEPLKSASSDSFSLPQGEAQILPLLEEILSLLKEKDSQMMDI